MKLAIKIIISSVGEGKVWNFRLVEHLNMTHLQLVHKVNKEKHGINSISCWFFQSPCLFNALTLWLTAHSFILDNKMMVWHSNMWPYRIFILFKHTMHQSILMYIILITWLFLMIYFICCQVHTRPKHLDICICFLTRKYFHYDTYPTQNTPIVKYVWSHIRIIHT